MEDIYSANDLAKLRTAAKSKIDIMKASALKKFLGIVDEEELKDFKIKHEFYSFSYNNSQMGAQADGGERYRRTKTYFENQSSNWREINIEVKYYVPSGYGDGNKDSIISSYILTDEDIAEIRKNGSRIFFVTKFDIKNDLDSKNDVPIKLQGEKNGHTKYRFI